VTRHRGEATRRRRGQEQLPSSPEEIGRILRDARERRGLDLLTVHDQISRPMLQIEALEAGDLLSLSDPAVALSTLRRYAVLLGLDGDTLALQMIEAWSSAPTSTRMPPAPDVGSVTGVVAAVTSGPEHLRAFTQTGQVPRVSGGVTSAAGGSGAYGYGVTTGPPTGMLSVIPRQEIKEAKRVNARARRQARAPRPLVAVTWMVGLLAVAAIAGTVIQRQRPQLLVQWHLLHITLPNGSSIPSPPVVPRTHHTSRATAPPAVVLGTTDHQTAATYTVASQHFTLGIAPSGPCWVQVTSPSSIVPLLVGVLPAGQSRSFDATGSITIQIGSSAVVLAIVIKGKPVFLNTPPATPFTYTFTSAPGS
jgi:Helix-turn-helix domain/Domain of unknown function (DUF4115)